MYFQGNNLHYKHKHTHIKKKKIQQHSFDQGIRLIFIYHHQFYTIK